MICPCKGCLPPKRRGGCHNAEYCPEWQEWLDFEEAKKEQIKTMKTMDVIGLTKLKRRPKRIKPSMEEEKR